MKPAPLTRRIICLAALALAAGHTASAADNRLQKLPDSLLPLPLVNGPEVRRALQELEDRVLPQSGWLESTRGRPLAAVTFVSADGYFLSKASELPRLAKYRLRTRPGDESLPVREVRRDVKLDLVLGQAVLEDRKTVFAPVSWASKGPAELGEWLCAPGLIRHSKQDPTPGWQPWLRLGVLSAARRPIPGEGAALGISMGQPPAPPDTGKNKTPSGVLITQVAPDSPARAAGLRAKDILIEIAGQPVPSMERVNELVRKRQPGEEILLRLLRDGQEISRRVRLASRSRVIANFQGDDYANGGTSLRTDDFPDVIQHDLPLNPHDMGGPVFDLEGRAVAINIARADRISTFALPVELFRKRLETWIENDRHPPKAEAVKKPKP